MTAPGTGITGERPLDDLTQTVSEQALALARQQLELAQREITAKVKRGAAGAAMVGGAALLTGLATGTGTAALVLLLSRRPGPSAAALGVTGLYAGASAVLAREGIGRLRAAGSPDPKAAVEDAPPVPQETGTSVPRLADVTGQSGKEENVGSNDKRGQNKARVLEALENGPMTASELSRTTGIGTASVSTLVAKLVKAGELAKAERGYKLPD
jgi:putative superfamily III holin-X/MarR family protein